MSILAKNGHFSKNSDTYTCIFYRFSAKNGLFLALFGDLALAGIDYNWP
jgi:hypothetical protein